MSEREAIAELIARVNKTQALLNRIACSYRVFLEEDFKLLGKKNTSAIVISEFIVDYYTCLETCFLRVSQFFENNLSADRWHADLLEKMTLRIEGVRDPVVTDASAAVLAELLKYRHFRRYYFELEYDWDKLDYLRKVFERIQEAIPKELAGFRDFLTCLMRMPDDRRD